MFTTDAFINSHHLIQEQLTGILFPTSDEEINLQPDNSEKTVAEWSREFTQMQYEWMFMSMSITNKTVWEFGFGQIVIVYTVSISTSRSRH